MAALYFIFNNFLSKGIPNYAAFLLIGITIWNWFSNCVLKAANSIYENRFLINQIKITKLFFPLESVFWVSFKSMIVFILLILFLVFYPFDITFKWTLIPILLLIQFVLILGVSILCAAIIPFAQDLNLIINTVMRLLFFASGIFFDIERVVSPKFAFLLYLNPIAGLIKNYRLILIQNQFPDWLYLFIVTILSLIILLIAILFTRKFDNVYPTICLQ